MKTGYIKRSATEFILDVLQHGAECSIDLFIMMSKNYHDSYRYARRGFGSGPEFSFEKQWSEEYRRRQNFYSLISKLKRDGLIEQKGGRGSLWKVTKKGKERSKRSKTKLSNLSWVNEHEKSPVVIIVSYDIPETFREERRWLREILKLLDYEMVHKSVFVGGTRLPEEFFRELENKKILEGVHIFEVGKHGTLAKIGVDKIKIDATKK